MQLYIVFLDVICISSACIFHVCFLLEISEEKENLGNIEFGLHYSLRVMRKLTPKLVLGQFLRERAPRTKKVCVYSKKNYLWQSTVEIILKMLLSIHMGYNKLLSRVMNWF